MTHPLDGVTSYYKHKQTTIRICKNILQRKRGKRVEENQDWSSKCYCIASHDKEKNTFFLHLDDVPLEKKIRRRDNIDYVELKKVS